MRSDARDNRKLILEAADFVLDDLVLMLMANGGIRTSTPAAAVAASRRFGAPAIHAFQASPRAALLPPAAPLTAVAPIPDTAPIS